MAVLATTSPPTALDYIERAFQIGGQVYTEIKYGTGPGSPGGIPAPTAAGAVSLSTPLLVVLALIAIAAIFLLVR